ncbi:alpha/beta fold hydrolase [Streptomyces griseus]|uniref:alpha/beta fold hydrolase n=1 Tax=Streptomyces griseus TaxID=1911 RepID=UPI0004CC340F|nr:alpha/beta hydrolase [Streptomyces griseus]
MSWVTREFVRGGVVLSLRDWGGDGPGVLLLHGLAGHCGEWDGLARRLAGDGYRVLALDQRGHGASERAPEDVSRAAYADDVLGVVEEYASGEPLGEPFGEPFGEFSGQGSPGFSRRSAGRSFVLVGQSYGGLAALLAAARRHPLVAGAVLVEAGPEKSSPEDVDGVVGWLRGWPVPFGGREEAVAYFGGGALGEGWAAGLEERDGGWWPRFDASVLAASLAENATRAWWEEWDGIDVPLLSVLGQHGIIGAEQWDGMARRQPGLRGVCLPGAGHDVHLERPEEVYGAVAAFLREVTGGPGGPSRTPAA